MATLREYFDTDFHRVANVANELTVRGPGFKTKVSPRVHMDHDANAIFVSCFVPQEIPASTVCRVILENIDLILQARDRVQVLLGHPGSGLNDMLDSSTARFTGRVYLYVESALTDEDHRMLDEVASARGLALVIRGEKYAIGRSSWEKPVAFVSHDSRDKESVARPIAVGLIKKLCPVWYDEFSLKVGDPLRESIEGGLKECRKCILVLSPNFLSNTGWTRAEFNSVFTRELIEQRDVVLPVWHGVSKREVYDYSPSLANRYALKWASGEEEVVRKLHAAIIAEDS